MKSISRPVLVAAVVAMVAIPALTSAFGHGKHDRSARLFERFDSNGDQVITQTEVAAVRSSQLRDFDRDGNGTLSLQEYEQLWLVRMRERMVSSFQRLDNDGDAIVTANEFNKRSDRMLARLDKNDDEQVTLEEAQAAKKMHKGGKRHGGHGGHSKND
jgi:Ca2+-binding EF-hand superfamily protein